MHMSAIAFSCVVLPVACLTFASGPAAKPTEASDVPVRVARPKPLFHSLLMERARAQAAMPPAEEIDVNVGGNTARQVHRRFPPPPLAPGLSADEFITFPSQAKPIPRHRAKDDFCFGDFNRDDVIDDLDLADFSIAFATREGPLAEFLDLTGDGFVDSADLKLFLRAPEAECDTALFKLIREEGC